MPRRIEDLLRVHERLKRKLLHADLASIEMEDLAIREGACRKAGRIVCKHPPHGRGNASRYRPEVDAMVEECMNRFPGTCGSAGSANRNERIVEVREDELDHRLSSSDAFLKSYAGFYHGSRPHP